MPPKSSGALSGVVVVVVVVVVVPRFSVSVLALFLLPLPPSSSSPPIHKLTRRRRVLQRTDGVLGHLALPLIGLRRERVQLALVAPAKFFF